MMPNDQVGHVLELANRYHVPAVSVASAYAPSFPGWPVGGFVATASFLIMVGAENTAANMGTD
jgi:hypothetical protein